MDSHGCLARDLDLSSQVLLTARQGFAYVPSALDPDFLAEIQREAAVGEYVPSGLSPGAIGDGCIFELFHPFGDYRAVLALAAELSQAARSIRELPTLAASSLTGQRSCDMGLTIPESGHIVTG